jgi:hypothetical protein
MPYSYNTLFDKAIINNNTLGLETIYFNQTDKIYTDFKSYKKFYPEVVKLFEILAKQSSIDGFPYYYGLVLAMRAHCSPFHNFIKPFIEQILGCKSYLTTGYIIDPTGFERHKFTVEDASDCLNKRVSTLSHHTWLTLDSKEIIDMTFPISSQYLNKDEKLIEDLANGTLELTFIAKHPNSLFKETNTKYIPTLVGNDFFDKANFNLNDTIKQLFNLY